MFGAPLDTGNLGVSALGFSTITAILESDPDLGITVFDYQPGTGTFEVEMPSGPLAVARRGAYRSRRWHRPENLRSMLLAARLAPRLHPNVRAIDRCSAVLDISGGDSFTDLYGPKRFALITLPKRIALQLRRPLHLLPQTYGPFKDPQNREAARQIVTGATTAWARDPGSFENLRELLGDNFDPERHRSGVDVAFLLPRRDPHPAVRDSLRSWAEEDRPIVGINVSGLLTNRPGEASSRFGLKADYFASMVELTRRFARESDARIVLVPHVRGREDESDDIACQRLLDHLDAPADQLSVLPTGLDAMESKWAISHLDWFVGARMHSTIAALSTGVPVAAVAYSDKTIGVFETCGLGDQVHDARRSTTPDLVDQIWASWQDREAVVSTLRRNVPAVVAQARSQFNQILSRSSEIEQTAADTDS